MDVRIDFIPQINGNRPGYPMTPKYITIHETANRSVGADALMHAKYVKNPTTNASWHYTVDDKRIVQHLPTSENGWHAGDGGNGPGNRSSIGIEICVNADGDYEKALQNAAWLTDKLMKEHNIPINRVVPHNHWSGKNCPTNLLPKFEDFRRLAEGKKEKAPKQQTASHQIENDYKSVSKADRGKRVESIYKGSDGLNFYDRPTWKSPVGTFYYGQGWTILEKIKVDGYEQYKVKNSKGNVYYITAADEYVRVESTRPSYIGKRVEAIVAKVNFYDSPRWNNPTGQFYKGQGWTIVGKLTTNGSAQYQVKNSKGDIYYITARKDLVKVIY